jgi:hypothetical protein
MPTKSAGLHKVSKASFFLFTRYICKRGSIPPDWAWTAPAAPAREFRPCKVQDLHLVSALAACLPLETAKGAKAAESVVRTAPTEPRV